MTRYTVIGIDNKSRPNLSGHSLQVAQVLDVEIGTEPLSRKTIDGVIRMAADTRGIGKYLNLDRVFQELLTSGFLEEHQA